MQNNVMDYLDKIVNKMPDKMAYSNGEESLTFKEVYDQSRSVASYIHNKGIYREPVIIFMNKHPKTISSFFGVIESGCYYVPIDEEMPQTRIDLILETCKSRLIICDNETIKKAREFQ